MNGADPLADLLRSLPPDQLQQILNSGTLDQKDTHLQQQQAQAQALREQANGKQAYGAGAGLGQGLASFFGAVHQGQLEDQQQKQFGQRQDSVNALVQALQAQQPKTGAPPQPAGDPSWSQSMGVQPGDYANSYAGPQVAQGKPKMTGQQLLQMTPNDLEAYLGGQ